MITFICASPRAELAHALYGLRGSLIRVVDRVKHIQFEINSPKKDLTTSSTGHIRLYNTVPDTPNDSFYCSGAM